MDCRVHWYAHNMLGNSSAQSPFALPILFFISFKMTLFVVSACPLVYRCSIEDTKCLIPSYCKNCSCLLSMIYFSLFVWHPLSRYTYLYNKIHKNMELHKKRFYFLSIKEFTWVKGSHSLHCYQIILIRNIFGSKQVYKRTQVRQ